MVSWTNQEKHIAFNQMARDETSSKILNIWLINTDGSNSKEFLHNAMLASWSPVGKQIVFNRGNMPQIYIMNSDSSDIKPLLSESNPFSVNLKPLWSPDGNTILFTKPLYNKDTGMNYEIFTVDKAGGNQKRLTDNPKGDMAFGWSPDGKQIVFMSDRDGNTEIYIMNSDGTAPTKLTNLPAQVSDPSWCPVAK
jgi:Tol biopolymer transport system component